VLLAAPQVFVTHFYNFYFAHTAGGRMIGKVSAPRPQNLIVVSSGQAARIS
jgi:hypothetical protein